MRWKYCMYCLNGIWTKTGGSYAPACWSYRPKIRGWAQGMCPFPSPYMYKFLHAKFAISHDEPIFRKISQTIQNCWRLLFENKSKKSARSDNCLPIFSLNWLIFKFQKDYKIMFNSAFLQTWVAKRLLNDWRHSWCTYYAFVGVRMTSLPVFRQTFGYPSSKIL